MNNGMIHIGNCRIVLKVAVLPSSAIITLTTISRQQGEVPIHRLPSNNRRNRMPNNPDSINIHQQDIGVANTPATWVGLLEWKGPPIQAPANRIAVLKMLRLIIGRILL